MALRPNPHSHDPTRRTPLLAVPTEILVLIVSYLIPTKHAALDIELHLTLGPRASGGLFYSTGTYIRTSALQSTNIACWPLHLVVAPLLVRERKLELAMFREANAMARSVMRSDDLSVCYRARYIEQWLKDKARGARP